MAYRFRTWVAFSLFAFASVTNAALVSKDLAFKNAETNIINFPLNRLKAANDPIFPASGKLLRIAGFVSGVAGIALITYDVYSNTRTYYVSSWRAAHYYNYQNGSSPKIDYTANYSSVDCKAYTLYDFYVGSSCSSSSTSGTTYASNYARTMYHDQGYADYTSYSLNLGSSNPSADLPGSLPLTFKAAFTKLKHVNTPTNEPLSPDSSSPLATTPDGNFVSVPALDGALTPTTDPTIYKTESGDYVEFAGVPKFSTSADGQTVITASADQSGNTATDPNLTGSFSPASTASDPADSPNPDGSSNLQIPDDYAREETLSDLSHKFDIPADTNLPKTQLSIAQLKDAINTHPLFAPFDLSASGQCSELSIDLSVLGMGVIQSQGMCDLLDTVKSLITPILLFVYMLIGWRIIVSA